jgi:hypothetical protein
MTADEGYVTGTFGRFKYLPWGLKGGHQGSRNYMQMIHADGSSQIFGKTAQYRLKRGEVARLVTGTGGGMVTLQTPGEDIAGRARRLHYPRMAEKDYGLAVDPARSRRETSARTRPPAPSSRPSAPGEWRPAHDQQRRVSICAGNVGLVVALAGVDRAGSALGR